MIYLYSGTGSNKECVKNTINALLKIFRYLPIIEINEFDLNDNNFNFINCILYIQPGGHAIEQLNAINYVGSNKIKNYIRNGGKYVGICAGVYITAKIVNLHGVEFNYDYNLNIINLVCGNIKNEDCIIKLDSNEIAYYNKSPLNIKDNFIKILDYYKGKPIIVKKDSVLLISVHLELINVKYFTKLILDFI
jgi:glutamine amidotransferase PdxT